MLFEMTPRDKLAAQRASQVQRCRDEETARRVGAGRSRRNLQKYSASITPTAMLARTQVTVRASARKKTAELTRQCERAPRGRDMTAAGGMSGARLASSTAAMGRTERILGSIRRLPLVRGISPWLWTVADAARSRRAAQRAKLIPDPFDCEYGDRTRVVPRMQDFWRTFIRGGVLHEPTAPGLFHGILRSVGIPYERTVFVDVGSGAGRVVLMASEYPFKAVIGIELSPELHAVAQANLRSFPAARRRAWDTRLVCGDATTYSLPPDPVLLLSLQSLRRRANATLPRQCRVVAGRASPPAVDRSRVLLQRLARADGAESAPSRRASRSRRHGPPRPTRLRAGRGRRLGCDQAGAVARRAPP